jgi:hypothetical protein
MTTESDLRTAPAEASPRRGAPSVVSMALVAVLVGTGLLAVQNCGGADSPAAQPPPPPPPPPPATLSPPPPTPPPPT